MARRIPFDMPRLFQSLGDPTRLRLLSLMADQEVCVCYLAEILDSPQPKISRHLAYLRDAGLVAARRDGKWMHYRIVTPAHPGAAQILRQTLDWLRQEASMRTDRTRLRKASCSPARFSLEGAPRPMAIAPTCCEAR
jgi:ArsR family transcriptional regulator